MQSRYVKHDEWLFRDRRVLRQLRRKQRRSKDRFLPWKEQHRGEQGCVRLSEIAYAARVLKLPVTGATYAGLADQGCQDGWSFEEYLAVVVSRQVAAREANGSQLRIRKAKFPRIHTFEDFNFDYQVSAPRELIAHLGTATFIANASNVILPGPQEQGKHI